jgi:hypothetical protein
MPNNVAALSPTTTLRLRTWAVIAHLFVSAPTTDPHRVHEPTWGERRLVRERRSSVDLHWPASARSAEVWQVACPTIGTNCDRQLPSIDFTEGSECEISHAVQNLSASPAA